MAKKTAVGKLAGQSVAFVGKFGYSNMHLPTLKNGVEIAGGKLADASANPDVLVSGDGRGGKPPGEVAKVQKKNPAVLVLSVADFVQTVVPNADDLIRLLEDGPQESAWWEALTSLLWIGGTTIDLRGANLRKRNVAWAKFEHFQVDGADFRGAQAEYAKFGDIANVNFDGVHGSDLSFESARDCTFREAELPDLHIWDHRNRTVSGCDFTGANLKGMYASYKLMKDCILAGAEMSEAQMEGGRFAGLDFSGANMSLLKANQSQFDRAVMPKVKLQSADLRKCSFVNADLRNADLRDANLSEADLTGANVAGADFAGAILTGAKLQGLDSSKAKNLRLPSARVVGPKVTEFAASAAGSKSFSTSLEADTADGGVARLNLECSPQGCRASSIYSGKKFERREAIPAANLADAVLNAAERWPHAKPRFETIQAKGSKTIRGKELVKLAAAAWAEAFDVAVLDEAEMQKQQDKRAAAAVKERDRLVAAIRSKGIQAWNALSYQEKKQFTDFVGVDFSGLDLQGAHFLSDAKMNDCNFSGANLEKASFHVASLVGANFTKANLRESAFNWNGQRAIFDGADLTNATLNSVTFTDSSFKKANLSGADFSNSKLFGVNFTGATLDGAKFDRAEYDETTIFPAQFEPPISMIWKGTPKPVAPVVVGSLDFPTFLADLGAKVEEARMKKASSMLKAEKFQLYSDVTETGFVGIVKSQSSKDLVYSCRLTSEGEFGCCTQNLMACGGLRGALCKHLLVLVVGLTKAGLIDPATVNSWVDQSRSKKPVMDKESQSESFLKYKGAEAGELDWRPTETIPEDFYAM